MPPRDSATQAGPPQQAHRMTLFHATAMAHTLTQAGVRRCRRWGMPSGMPERGFAYGGTSTSCSLVIERTIDYRDVWTGTGRVDASCRAMMPPRGSGAALSYRNLGSPLAVLLLLGWWTQADPPIVCEGRRCVRDRRHGGSVAHRISISSIGHTQYAALGAVVFTFSCLRVRCPGRAPYEPGVRPKAF